MLCVILFRSVPFVLGLLVLGWVSLCAYVYDVSHIAAVTHLSLASLGAREWIDWVDTASNPADGVSRAGVLDMWSQRQGWDISEVQPLNWYSYPSDPFTCMHDLGIGS